MLTILTVFLVAEVRLTDHSGDVFKQHDPTTVATLSNVSWYKYTLIKMNPFFIHCRPGAWFGDSFGRTKETDILVESLTNVGWETEGNMWVCECVMVLNIHEHTCFSPDHYILLWSQQASSLLHLHMHEITSLSLTHTLHCRLTNTCFRVCTTHCGCYSTLCNSYWILMSHLKYTFIAG